MEEGGALNLNLLTEAPQKIAGASREKECCSEGGLIYRTKYYQVD